MIEVIKKVVRAYEHGRFMKCGLDTLIRINEKKCFIDCNNCSFREKLDSVVCPYRMMNTHGHRVLI